MDEANPILTAHVLCKTFDRRDRIILDRVSLEIMTGESVAIAGPSGSGKTTLLSILAGLLPPDEGMLTYRLPGAGPATHLSAALRRRHVGIVFQSIHLIPTLTAAENVEVPLFGVEGAERRRRERAMAVLEVLDLAKMADWRPQRLSGGERQLVAVARAFVNRPALVFADEPTGNLDTPSSRRVISALTALTAEAGGSLIVVTHDEAVSARLDRKLVLVDGRLDTDRAAIREA